MPKGTFDIDFQGSQESKCIKIQSFRPAPVNHSLFPRAAAQLNFDFRLEGPITAASLGLLKTIPPWKISKKGIKKMACNFSIPLYTLCT